MKLLKIHTHFIAVMLLCLLVPAPLLAIEDLNGLEYFRKDIPVEVIGDAVSYDAAGNTYYASGDVIVTQLMSVLKADRVVFDINSGIVTAEGSVELRDRFGDLLYAESLAIDMNLNTAIAFKARFYYVEEGVYLWGEVIQKVDAVNFKAKKTSITTCECEFDKDNTKPKKSPPWRFYTRSAQLTIADKFTSWHTYLYIKDVPVLYTPYFSVPIKGKRHTGFLFPGLGFSELRGTRFANSFFWAISPSADATFYYDIESSRGSGGGVEARFYTSKDSYTEMYYYFYKENDIERVIKYRDEIYNTSRPLSAKDDRWELKFNHTSALRGNLKLKADIHLVSDDEYLIDFSESSRVRAVESLESTISLSGASSWYSFALQAAHFDNLLLEDDGGVYDKVPEFMFRTYDKKIPWVPLYISTYSNVTRFESLDGLRLYRAEFEPTIKGTKRILGLIDVTPFYTPVLTAYRVDEGMPETYYTRAMYKTGVDLSAIFSKLFNLKFLDVKYAEHIIRPILSYNYVPYVDQVDLPSLDTVDMLGPRNRVGLEIQTTIVAHSNNGSSFDLVNLNLSQGYDIREAQGIRMVDPDEDRPLENMQLELKFLYPRRVSVNFKADYNHYERGVDTTSAGIVVNTGRGDSLNLNYGFKRDLREHLEGKVSFVLTPKLNVIYEESLLIGGDDVDVMKRAVGLSYKHQCYGVNLVVEERSNETLIMLEFSLKGVGDVLSLSTGG
ncbi:MAG: LPS-assembly protein LptD [Deltaproteobacteria bacterium]|nr:LPS-assembly protein LptD [Deltaproteobacteria bacterium]